MRTMTTKMMKSATTTILLSLMLASILVKAAINDNEHPEHGPGAGHNGRLDGPGAGRPRYHHRTAQVLEPPLRPSSWPPPPILTPPPGPTPPRTSWISSATSTSPTSTRRHHLQRRSRSPLQTTPSAPAPAPVTQSDVDDPSGVQSTLSVTPSALRLSSMVDLPQKRQAFAAVASIPALRLLCNWSSRSLCFD